MASLLNLKWPEPMPIVLGRTDIPAESHYQDLAAKHNQARAMFLAGDYDALFFVECDMILPTNALLDLVSVNSDVAYGLYVARHRTRCWLAFNYIDDRNCESFSYSAKRARGAWGKVLDTQGVGLGCTLIRRHVLERISFRVLEDEKVADDWHFALDVMHAGFRQMHHFGVHCGHITPDGPVLWPDINERNLYRVEIEEDVACQLCN